MKKESIPKKIFNFFLHVFLAITSFFKNIFGKSTKPTPKITLQEAPKLEPIKEEKLNNINPTSLPDTNNVNSNDHNNDENATSSSEVILKLNNQEINKIKYNEVLLILNSAYELDELINECLEEEYHEEKLKINEASKLLKVKIKEFKEEIIDTIKENATRKQLETKIELKKEIKNIIKEEIKTKPLMPKLEDLNKEGLVEKRNHIYFLATPLKKVLNLNEKANVIAKPEILVTIPDKKTLETKLNEEPYFMVQNVDEVPKEDFKEDLKNAAIVGGMLSANAILDLVSALPKDEVTKEVEKKKKELNLTEDKPQLVNPENILEAEIVLPKLKELEEQLDALQKENTPTPPVDEIKEVEAKEIEITETEKKSDIPAEVQKESEYQEPKQEEILKSTNEQPKTILEDIKETLNEPIQTEDKEEITQQKEEVPSDPKLRDKIDKSILEIALASASLISSTQKEVAKPELEDKNYEQKEEQINQMLDDIEITLIKKMTEKQKIKLKQEQERLRNTKENLAIKKQEDITREANMLDATIKEIELNGLQDELKKLSAENQIEMNETLLNSINGLENLTAEQIANIDKKMLMKRLNKVSALMEMSSILALPFVRNKYFFYFTIGLIVDNHFNFINAFFKRKINRYEPADLDKIKQGEDALNSALNVTYKNQVQLEYIVNDALTRYPELADEPLFTNKVNNLRMQLEHNYQKMMKKKNVMEKYHRKTKSQIKVLKRTGDLEEEAA